MRSLRRKKRMREFKSIPLKGCMLCWNGPRSDYRSRPVGDVDVVPWPDRKHEGCGLVSWMAPGVWKMTKPQMLTALIIESIQIMINDKIDPEKMHMALMKIPEYRREVDRLNENLYW
jgi:hypothetical protein